MSPQIQHLMSQHVEAEWQKAMADEGAVFAQKLKDAKKTACRAPPAQSAEHHDGETSRPPKQTHVSWSAAVQSNGVNMPNVFLNTQRAERHDGSTDADGTDSPDANSDGLGHLSSVSDHMDGMAPPDVFPDVSPEHVWLPNAGELDGELPYDLGRAKEQLEQVGMDLETWERADPTLRKKFLDCVANLAKRPRIES